MIFLAELDGMGVMGSYYHYSMVSAFVASAFLIFLCLWRKKRLDMDEEPKYQMLEDNEFKDSTEDSHGRTRE